jgi:hypothetical protein
MYFLVKLYHNDIEDLCNNVYGVRMDITNLPSYSFSVSPIHYNGRRGERIVG